MFKTERLQELYDNLTPEDKKIFYFNHLTLDWEKYFGTSVRHGRRLILKDDESTIPLAQEKLKKFYYADLTLKTGFIVTAVWLFSKLIF